MHYAELIQSLIRSRTLSHKTIQLNVAGEDRSEWKGKVPNPEKTRDESDDGPVMPPLPELRLTR